MNQISSVAELASFIITFREALEVMIILGVLVAYIKLTKQKKLIKEIYFGATVGIVLSLILAGIFVLLLGEFNGTAEQLFEGITLLLGATLITFLIAWIIKTKHGIKGIKENVIDKVRNSRKGIFVLSAVIVLREGVEAIIFLGAAGLANGASFAAAIFGVVIGLTTGLLITKEFVKIDVAKLFAVISILLVLFAAGMVAKGVGELQEAKVLPFLEEKAFYLNPQLNADDTFPLLHEEGLIGGIAKDLFGYTAEPTVLQLLAYFFYLITTVFVFIKLNEKKAVQPTS